MTFLLGGEHREGVSFGSIVETFHFFAQKESSGQYDFTFSKKSKTSVCLECRASKIGINWKISAISILSEA